jgi:hypothetical protein
MPVCQPLLHHRPETREPTGSATPQRWHSPTLRQPAAQGLSQQGDPGRLHLPGQVIDLTQERPQLGVADGDHRVPQPGQQCGRRGHGGAALLDRRSLSPDKNLASTTDTHPSSESTDLRANYAVDK